MQQHEQLSGHVFDRGYAGSPWLGTLLNQGVGFVLHWPMRYQPIDAKGRRNTWKIAWGKPAQLRRQVWTSSARLA